jgi:hypothetical protein
MLHGLAVGLFAGREIRGRAFDLLGCCHAELLA